MLGPREGLQPCLDNAQQLFANCAGAGQPRSLASSYTNRGVLNKQPCSFARVRIKAFCRYKLMWRGDNIRHQRHTLSVMPDDSTCMMGFERLSWSATAAGMYCRASVMTMPVSAICTPMQPHVRTTPPRQSCHELHLVAAASKAVTAVHIAV